MLVHRSYYILGVVVSLVVLFLVYLTTPMAHAHDGPHVTVQHGETLGMIAEQHNTDVQTLLSLNNLDNLDLIRSGHILALPVVETVPLQPGADEGDYALSVEVVSGETLHVEEHLEETRPEEVPSENQRLDHVVQIGEGLGTIASYYGLTAMDLVALNQLSDPNLITPGSVLNVDASSIPSTTVSIDAPIYVPDDAPIDVQVDSSPITSTTASTNTVLTSTVLTSTVLTSTVLTSTVLTSTVLTSTVLTSTVLTSTVVTSTALASAPPTEEKWIDVDLSEQIVVAYEGATPVNRFIISSGLPWTPTVRGEFRIWAKTPIQDMYGGDEEGETDWYLEDVQWVQYFHRDYGFHGAYWHNNFGQPTSRGCINMRNEDAKWLFDWASPQDVESGWLFSDEENPGTLVIVHD